MAFSLPKLSCVSLIAFLKHALLSRRRTPNHNAWSAQGLLSRLVQTSSYVWCGCLFNQKGRRQMHLQKEMSCTLASQLQSRCIRVAPSHSIALGKANRRRRDSEINPYCKKNPAVSCFMGHKKNWTA